MDAILASLTDQPKHFPDCCCAISSTLISTLLARLPRGEASLVLSIGAGCGMLEEILRRKSLPESLNLFGIEVEKCPNKYLPEDRMLRVPSTTDLHHDGLMAGIFLFVYPRKSSLISAHLQAFVRGALQTVFLITSRHEWVEFAPILECAFSHVEIIQNCGLPAYEVLAMASRPLLAPLVPEAG